MKGGLKMVRYDLVSQDPAIDRKFVGKWYTLVGLKQIRELKMKQKHRFPNTTDSDLTWEEFINPTDFEIVLVLYGEIHAWVQLTLSFENENKVDNMSMVIFEKSPIFESLCLLLDYMSQVFEEVSIFTTKNSTTDRLINKVNDRFNNELVYPYLEDIIVYKFKKG